jgi:glycolate oxidase FAD binding subunit
MSAPATIAKQVSWSQLAEIVGKECLRPATPADAVDSVQPQMVAEAGSAEDLAKALRWAQDAGLKVSPRGSGTKLGWGNPPTACDLVLSTARLNKVIEHAWADMTVIVQAGCRVAELQKTLAEHGQRLALDPLWPDGSTIGGILSTNDSGTLRPRYGSLRDLIIGIAVVLPDGTIAKSGGKVVKNVAGYDLQKLFTGALGTLGVIVQAIFRLHPLPRESRNLTFSSTPETLNELMNNVRGSKLTFTGLQWRVESARAGMDIRFDGTSVGIQAQVDQLQKIAGSLIATDVPADIWSSHQAIWEGAASALVAKFSVLPTQLATLCSIVERSSAAESIKWNLVGQGVGAGYVRLDADEQKLRGAFLRLRDEIIKIGGSLVALGCPLSVKQGIDVWGPTPDSHPIMVRIKQRFDPQGTLNPGRFLGGI